VLADNDQRADIVTVRVNRNRGQSRLRRVYIRLVWFIDKRVLKCAGKQQVDRKSNGAHNTRCRDVPIGL